MTCAQANGDGDRCKAFRLARPAVRIAAGLACLFALWVRVNELGAAPLWLDEAFTWNDAHRSLIDLLGARVDIHPPLFYGLMHVWMPLGGETEFALRLPSALVSVLAVPAMWNLGRRVAGEPAGVAAALTIALAPTAIDYAREARMYGWTIALTAVILLAAERIAAHPTRTRWLAYGVAVILGLATHYTVVVAWAVTAARLIPVGRGRAPWLATQTTLALLASAWTWHLWANRDAWLGRIWHPWAGQIPAWRMLSEWTSAIGGLPAQTGDARIRIVLLVLVGVFAAVGVIVALRRDTARALALVALAVAPPLGLAILDGLRPVWNVRYTLVGLPAAILIASIGASAGRSRVLVVLGVTALLGSQIYSRLERPQLQGEGWRAVRAAVARDVAPGDIALGGVLALSQYYLGGVVPVRQRPIALGRSPEETAAEIDLLVGTATRVWLIPARDSILDPSDVVGAALARSAVTRRDYVAGGVTLTRITLGTGRRPIGLRVELIPIKAAFGGSARLVGYRATHTGPAQAPIVALSLGFLIDRPLPEDFKLFVHLLDSAGVTVAQYDSLLVDSIGRRTSQFEPGSRLRLEVIVEGPAEKIRQGQMVGIGLYQAAGPGVRLPLEPPAPEDRLVLPIDR